MYKEVDRQIEEATEYIVSLYRDIESELIYSITRTIVDKGFTPTLEHKLDKLLQLNEIQSLDEETLRIIADITGIPLQDIKSNLKSLINGSIDYKTLNKAYEQGLTMIKPSAVSLVPVFNQAVTNVSKEMNLIQSNVKQYAHKDFKRTIDKMVLETQLGTMSNDQAMTQAIKELSKKGITGATYLREGKEVEESLEAYTRKVIRTEFISTVAKAQEEMGDKLETEHFYVTQHWGARTGGKENYHNHAEWQGKVYTKEELHSICGYEASDRLGLAGINCGHIFFAFYKGISVEPPPQLDQAENERIYTLTQRQRLYERRIRQSKRVIEALKLVPTEEAELLLAREKKLLKKRQSQVRELVKENNDILKRDYNREKVISSD